MTRRPRILIVEDEILPAMAIALRLENWGYDVCKLVATGQSAIQSIEEEKPDIVFMDIHLAGEMDGFQAALEIRTRFNTPIAFMTGYSDAEEKKKAAGLKAVAYLTKPLDFNEIKTVMDMIFSEPMDE